MRGQSYGWGAGGEDRKGVSPQGSSVKHCMVTSSELHFWDTLVWINDRPWIYNGSRGKEFQGHREWIT